MQILSILPKRSFRFPWVERFVGNFVAYMIMPNLFNTKSYDPPKSRFFDHFLKVFDFSRKLSSQIWIFSFNRKYESCRVHLLKRLRPIFLLKKLWRLKKFSSIFWLVLKLFIFSRKLPAQIWSFGFNRKYVLWEAPLQKRLCPSYFTLKEGSIREILKIIKKLLKIRKFDFPEGLNL